MRRLIALGLTFSFCCAMALVALLVVIQKQGTAPPADVVLETDIIYGRGGTEALKLDLTRPRQGEGPFPAIVFVHGGGWVAGSKEDFRPFMYPFTQKGIVCISVNYRLAPKSVFPAQIEDVKCAVRWLHANAAKYHVDPKRILAFGGSAGAHLVALLGTTNGTKLWDGSGGNAGQSSAISAMVCMSGPYDLSLGYRDSVNQNKQEGGAVRGMLESFLGGNLEKREAQYREASPILYASKQTVPALLTHGTADPLVPIQQTGVFTAKLQSMGAEVEFMRIEGAGHADFGPKPEEQLNKVIAFVQKQLRLSSK